MVDKSTVIWRMGNLLLRNMLRQKDGYVSGIFGLPGTGKTTLMYRIMKHMYLHHKKPLIIWRLRFLEGFPSLEDIKYPDDYIILKYAGDELEIRRTNVPMLEIFEYDGYRSLLRYLKYAKKEHKIVLLAEPNNLGMFGKYLHKRLTDSDLGIREMIDYIFFNYKKFKIGSKLRSGSKTIFWIALMNLLIKRKPKWRKILLLDESGELFSPNLSAFSYYVFDYFVNNVAIDIRKANMRLFMATHHLHDIHYRLLDKMNYKIIFRITKVDGVPKMVRDGSGFLVPFEFYIVNGNFYGLYKVKPLEGKKFIQIRIKPKSIQKAYYDGK